jgi:Carboxypeptidase regulatory-like domain
VRTVRVLVAFMIIGVLVAVATRSHNPAPAPMPDDTGFGRTPAPEPSPLADSADPPDITGRIVLGDGRPAERATVLLFDELSIGELSPRTLVTGPDGRFAFHSGEEVWAFLGLRVRAEGEGTATGDVSAEIDGKHPRRDLGDLVLRPAVRPAVIVLTTEGNPLPGAGVELNLWRGEDLECGRWRRAETDECGQAEFPLIVRRDELRLEFVVSHPACRSVDVEVTEAELSKGPVRVIMDPGVGVTGRVVAEDGTPVDGARVVLLHKYTRLWTPGTAPNDDHSNRAAIRETGKDGRFEFPVPVAGELGYAPPVLALILRAAADGRVSRWHRANLGCKDGEVGDVVLEPGFEPVLRLRTPDGESVVGAHVHLYFYKPLPGWPPGRAERYHILAARTDREGRAVFSTQLREDDWMVRLEAEHPDHQKIDVKIPIADLLAGPVTVALLSGLTVTGRVLLPDGDPAAGYEVVAAQRNLSCRENDASTVKTAEDGSFTIRGVPARQGVLAIRRSVLYITVYMDVPSEVSGPTMNLGEIHLPKLGVLRGRVLDGGGEPIRRALVFATARGARHGNRKATTDAAGRFAIDHLPPGDYDLRANCELEDGTKLRSPEARCRPGEREFTICLSKAGTVLLVFRERSKPMDLLTVPSPEISLGVGSWSGGGMMQRKRIRPSPGVHEITVSIRGYRKVVLGDVEVAADRETVLDVYLKRAGR